MIIQETLDITGFDDYENDVSDIAFSYEDAEIDQLEFMWKVLFRTQTTKLQEYLKQLSAFPEGQDRTLKKAALERGYNRNYHTKYNKRLVDLGVIREGPTKGTVHGYILNDKFSFLGENSKTGDTNTILWNDMGMLLVCRTIEEVEQKKLFPF